ncbi:MAG: hypothetical protein ACKO2Z_05005 [Sphaerospermopsis kisseleviana]
MINRLIRLLEQLELDMSAEDIADALWLANQIKLPSAIASVDEVTQSNQSSQTTANILPNKTKPSTSATFENSGSSTEEKPEAPTAKAYTKDDIDSKLSSNSIEKPTPEKPTPSSSGVPFKAPAVAALPNALEIGRSLRPLMRKVPSRIKFVLDEENTVQQIAENDVWIPVLKPARERSHNCSGNNCRIVTGTCLVVRRIIANLYLKREIFFKSNGVDFRRRM